MNNCNEAPTTFVEHNYITSQQIRVWRGKMSEVSTVGIIQAFSKIWDSAILLLSTVQHVVQTAIALCTPTIRAARRTTSLRWYGNNACGGTRLRYVPAQYPHNLKFTFLSWFPFAQLWPDCITLDRSVTFLLMLLCPIFFFLNKSIEKIELKAGCMR